MKTIGNWKPDNFQSSLDKFTFNQYHLSQNTFVLICGIITTFCKLRRQVSIYVRSFSSYIDIKTNIVYTKMDNCANHKLMKTNSIGFSDCNNDSIFKIYRVKPWQNKIQNK